MKHPAVHQRTEAIQDAEEVVDYYLGEGAEEAALRFIRALQEAFDHIARHPAAGSPRYGHELRIPGLRSWPVSGFPHLVFYSEKSEPIEVWRILHGSRDIPATLAAND